MKTQRYLFFKHRRVNLRGRYAPLLSGIWCIIVIEKILSVCSYIIVLVSGTSTTVAVGLPS